MRESYLSPFDSFGIEPGPGPRPVAGGEANVDDAGAMALAVRERVVKDGEHRVVLGQHIGDEVRDAVGLGEGGEPDQEERRETVTVVGIGNLEGDLGLVLVGADGEGVSDDGLIVRSTGRPMPSRPRHAPAYRCAYRPA